MGDTFGGLLVGFVVGLIFGGLTCTAAINDSSAVQMKASGAVQRCAVVAGVKHCEYACPGVPWAVKEVP